jgi:hypothetical protein
MTDEQINAAIAEACGWTKINVEHRSGISPTNRLMMGAEFFPKYTKDLNAMHEAEQTLSPKEFVTYIEEVMELYYEPMRATARQRAEAFIRTLGKWEEVQG